LNLEEHVVEGGGKYNPQKKIESAQHWLRNLDETRKSQEELLVSSPHYLGGELVIDGNEGFSSLERLYCSENKLTKLKLCNLPELIEVQA